MDFHAQQRARESRLIQVAIQAHRDGTPNITVPIDCGFFACLLSFMTANTPVGLSRGSGAMLHGPGPPPHDRPDNLVMNDHLTITVQGPLTCLGHGRDEDIFFTRMNGNAHVFLGHEEMRSITNLFDLTFCEERPNVRAGMILGNDFPIQDLLDLIHAGMPGLVSACAARTFITLRNVEGSMMIPSMCDFMTNVRFVHDTLQTLDRVREETPFEWNQIQIHTRGVTLAGFDREQNMFVDMRGSPFACPVVCTIMSGLFIRFPDTFKNDVLTRLSCCIEGFNVPNVAREILSKNPIVCNNVVYTDGTIRCFENPDALTKSAVRTDVVVDHMVRHQGLPR
jgi:hypothetical protein